MKILLAILAFTFMQSSLLADSDSSKTASAQEEALPYGQIDTPGLRALLNSGAKIIVLDARVKTYDNGIRIPGAISLPFNSSEEKILAILPSKSALIVTYCANLHCPLSRKQAEKLLSMGYVNVIKYPDGISGWENAGYPIEKNSKQP